MPSPKQASELENGLSAWDASGVCVCGRGARGLKNIDVLPQTN